MATLTTKTSHVLRFDCYEADLDLAELRKRGIRVRLREQSFQVLSLLLEHPGQVVTREELRHRLWRDEVFVDFENNLNAVVAHLREKLCDSAEHPRYIETVPRRGYRFIGEVSSVSLPEPRVRRNRVLVLPFVNLSGDPAEEYVCDAMTDEIIANLASMAAEQVAVIARTTSMHYKGSHKDVARIRREVGVDYVVEGALRQTEHRIAVNVQLIQTADQAHLFARKYEAELHEIFGMQNSIARDIVTRINGAGTREEVQRRIDRTEQRRRPTANIAAYNDYIQGRYLAERLIPDDLTKAKQHFEDAIKRDPEFALPHMALADLYSWIGYKGLLRPKDAYEMGFKYALRAVELDDTLAEAHAVLAEYHKQLDYNWPAAEREMARAIELNGSSPFVRFWNSLAILMPQNRMREAVAELEAALQSDPLSVLTRCWLGIMLLLARDYDRGIEEARVMYDLEPNSCWPSFITGIAYRQKYFEASLRGNMRPDWAEKAIAEHRRAVELAPGADHVVGWLGFALGVCGRKSEARAVLEQFQRSDRYILPTSFAHVHYGLGEIDAAFEWFDRAVEERDQNMMAILSYAHYDPIRNDPRFAALLRKMKLAA